MNSGEEPPESPKRSAGFKGKRQRKGKLVRRKSSRPTRDTAGDASALIAQAPQDEDPTPEEDAATRVHSASGSIRSRVQSHGASRHLTVAELTQELKRTYAEIDASESVIEERDKTIQALTKRNKTLTGQLEKAPDAVRSARASAKEAGASARQIQVEANTEVARMSCLLEETEATREQEKAKFDREIRLKVAKAKEKAEVSILC